MPGVPTIAPNTVNESKHIGVQTIRRLNAEGERSSYPWLNTVGEMRIALNRMPMGKTGIVIGSGENTSDWKKRGWYTLDIDPSSGADAIHDANLMEEIVQVGSVDYLYAECLTMDPEGVDGVSPARLLQQANSVLKDGGILAVKTVNVENPKEEIEIPGRREYGVAFANHGFDVTVELHEYFPSPSTPNPDGFAEQRVVYYGRKVATGYSER